MASERSDHLIVGRNSAVHTAHAVAWDHSGGCHALWIASSSQCIWGYWTHGRLWQLWRALWQIYAGGYNSREHTFSLYSDIKTPKIDIFFWNLACTYWHIYSSNIVYVFIVFQNFAVIGFNFLLFFVILLCIFCCVSKFFVIGFKAVIIKIQLFWIWN